MSYTLAVIDMQYFFEASHSKKVQQACIREIKKAIKDKATILFVEYQNYGSTLPILTNIVKKAKYYRAYRVLKKGDDGSSEVMDFLQAKHLPRLNIRVVGVNTDACVKRTVYGIKEVRSETQFTVVADACNSTTKKYHKDGLFSLNAMENVKIIREK